MSDDMADETTDQAAQTPAEPPAPPAPAAPDPAPAPPTPAVAVDPPPAAEAPAAPAPPAEAVPAGPDAVDHTAADATVAETPAPDAGTDSSAAPAAEGGAPATGKPKRRRSRGGGKAAKAWGVKATTANGVPVAADLTPTGAGVPAGAEQRRKGSGQNAGGQGPKGGPGAKRKPNRPANRPPRPPREKGPLPFDELRDAARTIVEIHGKRQALKDAFGTLAPKERDQLSEIVVADGDFRVRARAISAGSLSAGKIGKALAAQQIAIADVQDLWTLTLSKEDAAERQSWVRNAKRRDEDRAKKQAERRNSADRISKDDMAKARDGHVTAKVRMDPAILAAFGGGGAAEEPQDDTSSSEAPRDKKAKKQPQKSSVLDRLGY